VRVLVCGGRDYGQVQIAKTGANNPFAEQEEARAHAVLDKLHAEAGIDCIIEGGARGADALAAQWARKTRTTHEPYPADWESFGSMAGPMRNTAMLTQGKPDLVIAFPGGRGTADMVRKARKAGVAVIEIAP
jgi:predicted Rossmann-fold nucleotide-binding protein